MIDLYRVTRVSVRYDKKPCEEAILTSSMHHRWEEWVVEIDGLAGLHQFIEKHGRVIIHNGDDTRQSNITIYDDYCE